MSILFLIFLVANKRLYKRVCPSVGPLVRRSVGPSVGPSVGNAFFSFINHLKPPKVDPNHLLHPSVRPLVRLSIGPSVHPFKKSANGNRSGLVAMIKLWIDLRVFCSIPSTWLILQVIFFLSIIPKKIKNVFEMARFSNLGSRTMGKLSKIWGAPRILTKLSQ